jgi:exonuclease V gamma subunit
VGLYCFKAFAILLSVRKQLIITYIGQSISENEDIPASVVIHELRFKAFAVAKSVWL